MAAKEAPVCVGWGKFLRGKQIALKKALLHNITAEFLNGS